MRGAPGSHFGQRIAWRDLTVAHFGVAPRYWLADDGGAIRGVLPLFERRRREPALFSAPGGLLADDPDVARALLEPARERLAAGGLGYAELRDQRRRWPDLVTSEEHWTLELALEATEEAQWRAFDAKLRNLVRRGEKAGFRARWGGEHAPDFHRVLLENMRDLGTPILGPRYYADALAALGGDAELLVLDAEDGPAAAMFVVQHAGVTSDPWASAVRRHFARSPNMVLYWEAVRRAIARGSRRFDFGRSQWDSGTFRFKTQWGATPVPLYYQYVLGRAAKLPTLEDQKSGFSLAVAVWRRLPLPLAGLLGGPARRLFPEVL